MLTILKVLYEELKNLFEPKIFAKINIGPVTNKSKQNLVKIKVGTIYNKINDYPAIINIGPSINKTKNIAVKINIGQTTLKKFL